MSLISTLPRIEERSQVHDSAAAETGRWRTEVVRGRAAFDALVEQWANLESQVDGAGLFQGSGWARAIFDFEAGRGNTRFDPVVVTLREGQRLLAVLPLERIHDHARAVLAPLGHAFSQYSDALISPDVDHSLAMTQLLGAAIAAAPCDMVSFLKVRVDSALAKGMPGNHVRTGTQQGAPYVALNQFDGFDDYFRTLKPKTRKNMRNDRNRLERSGPLSHHVAQSASETRGVIERTLNGRVNRLREQGLSSRAFRHGAFAEFCLALPDRPDLHVLAMSLCHHGEAIAEQWGFVHRERYYAFVASRDFAHSEESPGKLHLGEVIRTCAELGLVGADLMVPVMPYKVTWATEVITVSDYALPVTPRGVLMIYLWDKTMRPLLKRAVLNMPKGTRTVLMRLAARGLSPLE